MGKAAFQRKRSRIKMLSHLAKNNPDLFEREWDKRMASWMHQICKNAGKLKDVDGNRVASVFSIPTEALSILGACGEEVFRDFSYQTYDVLTTECCRQFSIQSDPHLFRPSFFPKPIIDQ